MLRAVKDKGINIFEAVMLLATVEHDAMGSMDGLLSLTVEDGKSKLKSEGLFSGWDSVLVPRDSDN